jgi:hypothetical protein
MIVPLIQFRNANFYYEQQLLLDWEVPSGESQWTTIVGTTNISYNSGNLVMGTATPERLLHLVHQSNGTAPIGTDEYGGNASDIRFGRARVNTPLDSMGLPQERLNTHRRLLR